MRAPHTRRSQGLAEQALPDFVPSHLGAEWVAVAQGRRNVLLAGWPATVDAMLASMSPHLEAPVVTLNIVTFDPHTGTLPAEGTLILPEIGGLSAEQQLRLLSWMDRAGGAALVQIVSTTSRAIMPLMERGAFRPELYYRLNVVRFDLGEAVTDLDS